MHQAERRRSHRTRFMAPASVETDEVAARGTVLDLSVCGVLFEAVQESCGLRVGDPVTVRMRGIGEDIRGLGRIVHCNARLLGIAFGHLDVEARRAIRRLVESQSADA